jgi:hypothetical protein
MRSIMVAVAFLAVLVPPAGASTPAAERVELHVSSAKAR